MADGSSGKIASGEARRFGLFLYSLVSGGNKLRQINDSSAEVGMP